jgi:hypothetical protein
MRHSWFRPLGEATNRRRLLRALVVLLVVATLGIGSYVGGRALTDRPSEGQAGSTETPVPEEVARPEPTRGTPTSRDGTLATRGAEPSATGTGQAETSSPTTPSLRATPTSPTASPTAGPASPTGNTSASPAADPSKEPSEEPSASQSPADPSASATPIDTTPPQTDVSGDFSAPGAALFAVSADEPATFACSLDGAAYAPCGAQLRLVDLAAGWHTLAVRATDLAGNTDPTPAQTRWHSDRSVIRPGG